MNYRLPGSFDHGIFQTRILEWVAISFSRASFQSKDQTWISCIASRFFTVWATWEAQEVKFQLEVLEIESRTSCMLSACSTTEMSIYRWMDKEDVVHIYNGILFSHKRDAFELVGVRWIKLELAIHSEESQKEKYKCHVLMNIWRI